MGTLADKLKPQGGLADKLQPQQIISHSGIPLSIGQQIKDVGNSYVDLQKKGAGIVGNIIGEIAQPFVSLAATPVQAAAKIAGQQDPYRNGIPLFGGKTPVSPLSIEAKGGDLLKAGAEIGAVAAAPATLPGTVATGAGIGAAQGAGEAMQQEKNTNEVAKSGGIGATIGAVTAGASKIIGDVAKSAGKKIYDFVIPTSMKEAKLLQSYRANVPFTERLSTALAGGESKAPTTAASTAFDQGLKGTESMIGIQAKRASNNIWKDVIKPSLDKSNAVVDMPTFFDSVEKKIISETPELSRQKDLLEALQAMKEDYSGVGQVTLNDLQKFKEGWAQFVPEKAYMGKPISGAFNDVKDTAADLARQAIYNNLGKDVKKAYFDYGNLQGLQELGQKAMTGGKLKGGFGSFWSAIKDMALTPIGTVGGRTLYRTGQGIQFFGKPGAAILSDILTPKMIEVLQGGTDHQSQEIQ